jgi:signal transduction histidine kinase
MADLLSNNINSLTRSEKERKEFIAAISHDIRTPLSIARGYAETLLIKKEGEDLNTQQREQYMQLVLEKIEKVEVMVKQLSELSKMEAAEFKPHNEPFVLSEIVQETVNTFGLMAAKKGVDLKCTQCQYHVWINADIGMMERVVQNLVDNAVKNTAEGGEVQVSMAVENEDLVFNINNTGPALPEDLLQWLNTYTDDESSLIIKRPQKLGLGLLIVQKILHLHGTSLKAHTHNGSNIFTFRMPVYN